MVSASDLQEVDDLEQSLESLAGKSGGDFPSITLYLQLVRKHKLRRSETVTRHGMTLLNSKLSRPKLGNECKDFPQTLVYHTSLCYHSCRTMWMGM